MARNYTKADHLYNRAKEDGYSSRAAYKLEELNKRYKFLKSGLKVLDLGSAPGGWLDIYRQFLGSGGTLVALDKEKIVLTHSDNPSYPTVKLINGDISDENVRKEVTTATGGQVDIISSDLSPKLSGIRFRDVALCGELVEIAFAIACELLRSGGVFIAKTFPGAESDQQMFLLRKYFDNFSRVKLKSTRKTSTEMYFVGIGFHGPKI